jgi:hypothetical protein
MTDTPAVVIPYTRFLEWCARRDKTVAERARREEQRTVDVEAVAVTPGEPREDPTTTPLAEHAVSRETRLT